jgi:hypothetical protein
MNDENQTLDRLNYFNGQRLEASDLKVEQNYHIFVRRILNRSLYSPGIASGLEVTEKADDKHKVVVSPGLALDSVGREIVLLDSREVQVIGSPSEVEGVVFGNYLVIEYDEAKTAETVDGCTVKLAGAKKSKDLSFGGPTRIRADAKLSWRSTWPSDATNQIVLAQVELDKSCAVFDIRTYVRKYAGLSPSAKVHQFALEGDADIAEDNPKRIYFHIRGGRPKVTLYLKGEKFSSLYYTELGRHSHPLDLKTVKDGGHTHGLLADEVVTKDAGAHGHSIVAAIDEPPTFNDQGFIEDNAIMMDNFDTVTFQTLTDAQYAPDGKRVLEVKDAPEHHHELDKDSLKLDEGDSEHRHDITGDTENTGVTKVSADPEVRTTGARYRYADDLRVTLDGVDYTQKIRDRVTTDSAPNAWNTIGDGTKNHALVATGTGPVELTLLGADLSEGEHIIELSVPSGGGRVHYNLYVE